MVNGISKRFSMPGMSFKRNNLMNHHNKHTNNDQEKVKFCFVSHLNYFLRILLVAKPPTYPNHVLHPEVIPSLNEVPAELIKRRNIRFTDPLAMDSFETEIPLAIASSLQDELERAVQHRLVLLFRFHFFDLIFL